MSLSILTNVIARLPLLECGCALCSVLIQLPALVIYVGVEHLISSALASLAVNDNIIAVVGVQFTFLCKIFISFGIVYPFLIYFLLLTKKWLTCRIRFFFLVISCLSYYLRG